MTGVDAKTQHLVRRVLQLRAEIRCLESELRAHGVALPVDDQSVSPVVEAVRKRIAEREITITAAAGEMGYTRQRLSTVLKGRHRPGPATSALLYRWLEVTAVIAPATGRNKMDS